MYLQTDLKTFDFSSLGMKFDVILLEPPLEEYQRRASGVTFSWSPWEWEEVRMCLHAVCASFKSFFASVNKRLARVFIMIFIVHLQQYMTLF